MKIKVLGMDMNILFMTGNDAEYNELKNYVETHNLHLYTYEDGWYSINDVDYEVDRKDITKLLKVLKESKEWLLDHAFDMRNRTISLVISHRMEDERAFCN